ncbi:MAG: DUF2065 domain-containing protein [Rhodoferax sp.]|uniref:DUF2065 domain-containing protein n=1 Tax=Rhodoferax potami TaxID=3068338 RepID=A0ABU3KRJ9_9BURK|nr:MULTISPECIES: DUF2065 domain-containing protein [unclassified Rhodoferax]MDT7520436.1 DUF2065 domain-containing protein [Rhodoferax sp. TBRC 17660]MDT7522181.1 DUF2065 domain-containing protein [Rhodoferax sp. TBRC 17198]MDZ7892100.1 DUF2065 domain-containing protein [Rhodoferax sp.]
MSGDTLWVALALVLVLEGLFPFASPRGWRKLFEQLLQLQDGQIRFYGLCSIVVGLVSIWWMLS